MHFHAIIALPITTRWLKDNAAACGFGYMDDAKEVWSEGGVTGYVVKYLAKTLTLAEIPPRTRRVRTSRHWPREDHIPPENWTFVPLKQVASIADAYHGLIAQGYSVALAGSKTAWLFVGLDD